MYEDEYGSKWNIPLIFACLTIPILIGSCAGRQDCYYSREDCEKDWSSGDCQTGPATVSCPYVGRAYTSGFRGWSGPKASSAMGIHRGGFGSTGRGFYRGG